MNKRVVWWLSAVVVAAVVLVAYAPAIRLNFYADDYSFIEKAGRTSLAEYLTFYFDPAAQTGWYRPMQGMYFGIEYLLFGANPVGYHALQVLVHVANCLLLWCLVGQVTRRPRAALVATLLYAVLPLYGVAVFWPGDADFCLTLFYLLSLLAWVAYLQTHRRRYYTAALVAFWLALLTKEFGVTLPVVLCLADLWLIGGRTPVTRLIRTYAPFWATWLVYLPIEYTVQSHSVLVGSFGYGVGMHSAANLVNYLAMLAFPWGLPAPANYVWLAVVAAAILVIVIVRRNTRLLFLAGVAVLAFLPVVNFPWFVTRYLYLSAMAPSIVLGFLCDGLWTRLQARKLMAWAAPALVALLVGWNAAGVAGAAAEFAELGRLTRVPFRDIAQRHATFAPGTYLYFVDPASPLSEYSGMFFMRYGPVVEVAGNTAREPAPELGGHTQAYVVYSDARGTHEIAVDDTQVLVTAPVEFQAPIRLRRYEMPNTRAAPGGALVLFLFWNATGVVDRDYTVVAHLVDARTSRVVAEYDGEPPGRTRATSTWKRDGGAMDIRVLPVPETAAPGTSYRLEIGLRDESTGQSVPLAGAPTAPVDRVVIEPVHIQ